MTGLIYQDLTRQIIGLAMKVHRQLGPGFVEKVYQRALYLEFKNAGLKFEREKKIGIMYDKASLGYFEADFIVNQKVIVEIKATEYIGDVHLTQLISYLKAASMKIGSI